MTQHPSTINRAAFLYLFDLIYGMFINFVYICPGPCFNSCPPTVLNNNGKWQADPLHAAAAAARGLCTVNMVIFGKRKILVYLHVEYLLMFLTCGREIRIIEMMNLEGINHTVALWSERFHHPEQWRELCPTFFRIWLGWSHLYTGLVESPELQLNYRLIASAANWFVLNCTDGTHPPCKLFFKHKDLLQPGATDYQKSTFCCLKRSHVRFLLLTRVVLTRSVRNTKNANESTNIGNRQPNKTVHGKMILDT